MYTTCRLFLVLQLFQVFQCGIFAETNTVLVCQSLDVPTTNGPGQNFTEQRFEQLEEGLAKLETKVDELFKKLTATNDSEDLTTAIPTKATPAYPANCAEIYKDGKNDSGVYTVEIKGEIFNVFCDMETAGGGWTVFQRRKNGETDFQRSWRRYRDGFGNLSSEFWLGNKYLALLTSHGHYALRVDLRHHINTNYGYAEYTGFRVGPESDNFRLRVEFGSYNGNVGNKLYGQNGAQFTTGDKDHDEYRLNCAMYDDAELGGFWYTNCGEVQLNSKYDADGVQQYHTGIRWGDWPKGSYTSLLFTEMKLRPENSA